MSYLTLKDLAKILKVSESTVSRALRDHPRISKATRKRVKDLAAQLDYTPNQIALDLSRRRMHAVGVVVPSISYHLYAEAISGMESILEKKGFNLIICQSNESYQREQAILKELSASRIAGLIISLSSATQNFNHFAKIKSRNIPLVFFNRECRDIHTDRVIIDNQAAAFSATEYLIKTGCKRIAYLGGPRQVQISNKRLEGFHQALKKYGINKSHVSVIHTEFNQEDARRSALKLLKQKNPPEGILAFSDQIAYQVFYIARQLNIPMPTQLSLIGFNNEPAGALLEPALSSIAQPAHKMGEKAAELLLSQILPQKSPRSAQTVTLQSTLVCRESTRKMP